MLTSCQPSVRVEGTPVTSKARQQLGPPHLRVIRMDSKAAEREPPEPDLYSVTLNGYMIGYPLTLERIAVIREWLENGGLREIDNLYSESGSVER